MNRRHFIKSGALFGPTIFIPRLIRAQDIHANILKRIAIRPISGGGGGGQAAAFIGNNLDGSGNIITDSGADTIQGATVWGVAFTCPGTGTRTLDSLGGFVVSPSGTPVGHRFGIYTGAGTFVAQTGQLSTSSTTALWVTSSSFFDVTLSVLGTVNLTGGSQYILTAGGNSADSTIHYKSIVSAATQFNGVDGYTLGFPATLVGGTETDQEFAVRGHVAAA